MIFKLLWCFLSGNIPPSVFCYFTTPCSIITKNTTRYSNYLSLYSFCIILQDNIGRRLTMRLSCLQENLSKGLAIAGRAVATRTTLPITTNILITAEESRLRLTATNLEIAISCWIGAKVEEEGSITIPARLLTDFVNSLPNDKIEISLSKQTLSLKCARMEANISGMDADDFPPIPKIGDGVHTEIDPAILRSAITQVVFAAASDETRPVLTGVKVEFKGDKMTLASADGFRLAVHEAALPKAVEKDLEAIIPGRSLAELSRLLADQEDPVKLSLGKNQVLFSLKNVEMVSQLLQGEFPHYRQLIPATSTTRVECNTQELLRAVKVASIFARDSSGIVRLQIAPGEELVPGKMIVSARSEQIGDDMAEIDVAATGEPSKIAFNGKYLVDVLNVIGEEQSVLEITSPSSPGVLRPVGRDNYIHVVMPMFVQW